MPMRRADLDRRRENLRHRRFTTGGRLISTIIPEHLHGRPTGYIMYGCHCATCNEWARTYRRGLREQQRHNQAIIDQLAAKTRISKFDPNTTHVGPVTEPKAETPEPEPQPETQPEPQPERKIVVGAKNADLRRPFPTIPAVRERITDIPTFEAISAAYHRPQWTTTGDNGRERRAHGNMEIIVDPNGTKPVIFFHEREVATGDPTILNGHKKGVPKAKGGRGGSRNPKTFQDLIKKLKAAGCSVDPAGSGHLKIGKNGRYVTIPASPSDYRSLPNSVADARREGLL